MAPTNLARAVYPRVHGGNLLGLRQFSQCRGLSPRTRGKRRGLPHPQRLARSIPAYTGETGQSFIFDQTQRVYPRVHGGNGIAKNFKAIRQGLSPRTRGKHHILGMRAISLRSIPAYTGETLCPLLIRPSARVYPRVHGGNCGACI